MVDNLEPYKTTLELISHNEQDRFVERLLDKLQRSGYLYHPGRRFAVLMLIFRLFPDKVGNYLKGEKTKAKEREAAKKTTFCSSHFLNLGRRLQGRQIEPPSA